MQESDGAYYFAETIANGMGVDFYAYYEDASLPLDDALLTNLHSVLASLRKATAPQSAGASDGTAEDTAAESGV